MGVDFVGVDLVAPIATECCEWLLLTRVNLKLYRHSVVVELLAVTSIIFHAKMMVITLKWYFYYHTLLHLAAFHMAFGQLHESC